MEYFIFFHNQDFNPFNQISLKIDDLLTLIKIQDIHSKLEINFFH